MLNRHVKTDKNHPDMLVFPAMEQPSAKTFQSIGLLAKHGDKRLAAALQELVAHLEGQKYKTRTLKKIQPGDTPDYDLLVVLGGDGTMLNAARALAGSGVPLVGINAGRLGFLTDLAATDIPQRLDDILNGHYTEERRALLHMQLGKTICLAMNDVVVQKRDGRMIEFETWVDGHFVCAHRADGVVIATPTGSTAYALSSGGPILNPGLDALVMVPICPHTLTDRPVVIDGNSQVEIVLHTGRGMQAQVSCDGQSDITVPETERVIIQRAVEYTTLLHPTDYDYYKTLRNKLHWGKDKEQDISR